MSDQDKTMATTEETTTTATPNDDKKAVVAEAAEQQQQEEDNVADEEDLEQLQAEIAKMEEEARRIAEETASLEKNDSKSGAGGDEKGDASAASASGNDGEKAPVDRLSIYVGQVDYNATPEELLAHFEPCGTVERVTINCDKFTGMPRGYAYLEFQSEDAVSNAIKLEGSTFKGRTLKVTRKRVNDPNFKHRNGGYGGGRGGYGGGRGPPPGAGGFDHDGSGHDGHGPPFGGRGGRGRGRGPPMYGGRGPPFRGGHGGRMPFRGGGRRGGYRGGFRGGRGGGGYHPYY